MDEAILSRKGARKVQEVPPEILDLLHQGTIASVNLTEWLAINHQGLIKQTFPALGLEAVIPILIQKLGAQRKPTAMSSTKIVGEYLYAFCVAQDSLMSTFKKLAVHSSDSIRCYAPYLVARNEGWGIEEKLERSKNLVSDDHFGVREIVWMALRPAIEQNLTTAIEILTTWTTSPNENIRRFTTEATRPRGVWCKHIESLKARPEQALPILNALKADPAKYVQDSVGNWLNDASKTSPAFVTDLCANWERTSASKNTQKIIKKAMRTIRKKQQK
ncbi:MAG: DNA alkylation repair protein [Bacteroidota bacterium]